MSRFVQDCRRHAAWGLALAGLCSSLQAAHHTRVGDVARTVLTAPSADDTFSVTARVTYVIHDQCTDIRDQRANTLLTFEDASGSVYSNVTLPSRQALAVGDWITADGIIQGNTATDVSSLIREVSRIRGGTPPVAMDASLSDVISGALDWRPVRIRGFIRDVLLSETNPNWAILILADTHSFLYLSTPLNGTPLAVYERFIGRQVSVTGVANPKDGSKRAYVGRIFQFSDPEALTFLDAGARDPYDAPDLSSLRAMRPAEIAIQGRHRVQGLIRASWGHNALLMTPSGETVRLICETDLPPKPDQFVEVSGFPLSDFFHITLARTCWRTVPSQSMPRVSERVLTLTDINRQKDQTPFRIVHHQGRSVHVEGRVRYLPEDDVRSTPLQLEVGADIIPIDLQPLKHRPTGLEKEARIAVTGICVLETDYWQPHLPFPRIRGFRLIVNTPDQIRILSRAPWWTPGRFALALSVLLVVLVLILLWNHALRILAERRGRQLLREQFGHVTAQLKTEERTRLAVELHDTLAQNLTGVSLELEAACALGRETPPAMQTHLGFAARALKSCRDELRNCLWDLRCQALEESDMNRAILKTLQPHVNGPELDISFAVPRSRLSDNTAHALLRMIRELVVNAVRHGGATALQVEGRILDHTLRCTVTDNGSGVDPGTSPGVLQGHFGLQGIRERVEGLSGSVTLESAPGHGTRVTLILPIPQENPPHGQD